MKRLIHAMLLAASVGMLSSAPSWAQVQGGSINGRVTDTHGQIQNVSVKLLAEGDIPAGECFTGSNGNFSFTSLPNGVYYVVVEAPSFVPFRQSVRLDMRLSPSYQMNVTLERIEKNTPPPNPIISGSPKTYQLNAQQPPKPANEKALREYEKGNENERKGDFGRALACYQKALKADPEFYPAWNNLGTIYLRQKDPARAKDSFEKVLRLNPDDAEAYINEGHAYYDENEYQKAVEFLEEGLKRSPQSALGHFFLGSANLKLEDYAKAETHLKKAYTLDPSHMSPARLQLANLYLKRHDLESAREELTSYLQANPRDPQAPAIKKMLANIKAN